MRDKDIVLVKMNVWSFPLAGLDGYPTEQSMASFGVLVHHEREYEHGW